MSESPSNDNPRPSRTWVTLRKLLRARITAGLIVILPIWITFLLVKFLFEFMRDASLWAVEWYLETDWGKGLIARWGVSSGTIELKGLEAFPPAVRWAIGIFCVFLTIFFLYSIGVLTANFVGRRYVAAVDVLVGRVPLVKTVYRATKQILSTVAGEQTQNFQRVVLFPFPSRDIRSIGFVTSVSRDTSTGEEICTVFMASTPNPTTGFLFVLPRRDLIEVDWSIEEAFTVIMSGGGMFPPSTLTTKQGSMTPPASAPVSVRT